MSTPVPPPETFEDPEVRLRELIEGGDGDALTDFLDAFHPSDVADLVETLDDARRVEILSLLPAELASETLAEMEEEEDRGELLAALDPDRGAELLQELHDDDAADLIAELEPAEQTRLLASLPLEEAGDLRGLLLFGEETAGGRMTTELVVVSDALTSAQALDEVRRQGREVEDFFTVFVVDDERHLVGTVPLNELVLSAPGEPVSEIVEPAVATVLPDLDQEEVGRIMARYNLVSVPVVSEFGVLLGRVTFDDVIDVMEAEQTEDILRLAGLSDEEELRGGWGDAVRSRLPWLSLNLVTASLAATVILVFEDVIAAAVVLAAIMPVIAGLGGNAGTQALAVTVRLIAISDGPVRDRARVLGKELLTGIVNGLAVGVLFGIGVAALGPLIGANISLGLVVFLAMVGNILVASFLGAFIPLFLDGIGVDPAVASSVFVTTLTDLFGFFLLLGLASAVLL